LRPDLATVHARALEFSCELALGPEELEQLRGAFRRTDGYEELPWLFLNRYRASGVAHLASAVVTSARQRDKSLRLEFNFWTRARVAAGVKAKAIADLVRALSQWEIEATFDCSVALLYPKKGWTSRVSLPVRLFEHLDLPFDELRGLRAVKIEDRKTAYSVIIDRPENKSLSHVVQFSHSAAINDHIGDDILARGAYISSLFVRADEGK
jgi:hypothetical protein